MKVAQAVLVWLFIGMAVLHAGKITWDANGKPHIEHSGKKERGCHSGGFKAFTSENNATKKCK